jgi:hypothetical protein
VTRAPRRYWTEAEIELLRELYPRTPMKEMCERSDCKPFRIYSKAEDLGLRRDQAYIEAQLRELGERLSGMNIGTRFKKGNVPWSKGLSIPTVGRMAETQFKKGQVSRRWDPEIYSVGALRINSDGYLEIKLRPGCRSWYGMARFVWETERGPIPPDFVVRVINGDPDDTRIENLHLVSRRALMLANTIHNYPKEIAQLTQLRGALTRKINRLEKARG